MEIPEIPLQYFWIYKYHIIDALKCDCKTKMSAYCHKSLLWLHLPTKPSTTNLPLRPPRRCLGDLGRLLSGFKGFLETSGQFGWAPPQPWRRMVPSLYLLLLSQCSSSCLGIYLFIYLIYVFFNVFIYVSIYVFICLLFRYLIIYVFLFIYFVVFIFICIFIYVYIYTTLYI